MNKNYFEVKIRYDKTDDESGAVKKVTESYILADMLSFSQTELKILMEFEPMNFEVESIKKDKKLTEVFDCEGKGDKWYRCKINMPYLDEKTGAEKKSSIQVLTKADNIEEARLLTDRNMTGTMSDYEIESIKETKIQDVLFI